MTLITTSGMTEMFIVGALMYCFGWFQAYYQKIKPLKKQLEEKNNEKA